MNILAKIAAFWRPILARIEEDGPSYPLMQEEWEVIQAAAQVKETLQELGLAQHGQGWAKPDKQV